MKYLLKCDLLADVKTFPKVWQFSAQLENLLQSCVPLKPTEIQGLGTAVQSVSSHFRKLLKEEIAARESVGALCPRPNDAEV